jgi:hypothetical protein
MRLNEIQTRFKDILLSQERENPDAEFYGLFESGDIALKERLKIYHNNMMGSVGKALTDNFPLLEKLAGREFLNVMVRTYIMEHPPRDGYLGDYGSDFGEFLEGQSAIKNFPWLADIARLEVFINLSMHARDDVPMMAPDLAVIPSEKLETLRLKPRDCVFFLKSGWNLIEIRDFCLNESNEAPYIKNSGVFLMIYRTDYPHISVEILNLMESEYEFMNRIQTQPLGLALEETLRAYPDFDFQTALQRHITLQTFLKPEKLD